MKEEKVKIENSADLFKIPIDVINKTKLYNFYGKYYDKIYEEALKIERNGNVSEQVFQSKIKRIEKINFELNFQSEYGQRLLICGSNSELGNWDVSNSLELIWSVGNVWTAKITFSDQFEYKLILKDCKGDFKWESGLNRIFDFNEVKMLIESLNENLLSKTPMIVNIRDEKIIYDHINSILTIQSTLNPIKMF